MNIINYPMRSGAANPPPRSGFLVVWMLICFVELWFLFSKKDFLKRYTGAFQKDRLCGGLFVSGESRMRRRVKSRSEIAALLSAVGGFSYLMTWIRVTNLCTSQLQHYLVRSAALITWWCGVGSRNLCTSQYTVLCTMWYTVKFTVYCVVYSTVYCWLAHSPPNRCRLHRRWHV